MAGVGGMGPAWSVLVAGGSADGVWFVSSDRRMALQVMSGRALTSESDTPAAFTGTTTLAGTGDGFGALVRGGTAIDHIRPPSRMGDIQRVWLCGAKSDQYIAG